MTPQCIQAIANGQTCKAPAVNGSRFCRHHDLMARKEAELMAREESGSKSTDSEPLILPPLVDKPSILAALNVVLQALAEGRIKRSVADTLLSGIKLANRLVNEIAEAGLTPLPAVPAQHYKPTLAGNSL